MRRDPLHSSASNRRKAPCNESESSAEQDRRLNILHVEDDVDEVNLTRHLLSREDDIQFDVKNAPSLNVGAQD